MDYPRVLIDTSIIIEHLRKQDRQRSILYRIVDNYVLCTSAIVEFELYSGAIDDRKLRDVQEILEWCELLPLTSEVAQVAARTYRDLKVTNQLIEVSDIFIAATALAYGLPLLTLNTGHFSRIERLRLQSWP